MEENILKEENGFSSLRDEYTVAEREYGELKSRLRNNIDRKKSMEKQIQNLENRLKEGEDRGNALKSEFCGKSLSLTAQWKKGMAFRKASMRSKRK